MKLNHATGHKKPFLLACLYFVLLFSIFSLDSFVLFRIVLLGHTFTHFFFNDKKYCYCNLSLRKKKNHQHYFCTTPT